MAGLLPFVLPMDGGWRFWTEIFQSERLCGIHFMRRDSVSDLLLEDSEAFLKNSSSVCELKMEPLCRVLEHSHHQLFQTCLCSFGRETVQNCFFVFYFFLTPGLPPWIVCGGDWINEISWDMGKPAKSLLRLGAWGLCSDHGFCSFWRIEGKCHCSSESSWDVPLVTSLKGLSFTICKTNGFC